MWLIFFIHILFSQEISFSADGRMIEIKKDNNSDLYYPVWDKNNHLIDIKHDKNTPIESVLRKKVIKWYRERKIDNKETPNSFYQCH